MQLVRSELFMWYLLEKLQKNILSGAQTYNTAELKLHVVFHCVKCFTMSVLSRIWTEYGEILRISPYSFQMRKNTDQNNSEYRHFSRSVFAC